LAKHAIFTPEIALQWFSRMVKMDKRLPGDRNVKWLEMQVDPERCSSIILLYIRLCN
jgi:hypothetical protein